ncbi:MAG: M48 family metallopeptidase [Tissierellia bacterium]|nr:M48 family metallopeptidase [Tissierellia bacterium]
MGVSAPEHMEEEIIRRFILSKLAWIKKHRQRFVRQKAQAPRRFLSGEIHFFMGSGYIRNLIEFNEKQRVELRSSKHMDLYVRPGHTKEKREEIIRQCYGKELKNLTPGYIKKCEAILGVEVSHWGLKRRKTRWGSCNIKDKRIWLNLELAKKEPRCLEYVIVHEMVPLLEGYHNDTFKTDMSKFLPNWKVLKNELNN